MTAKNSQEFEERKKLIELQKEADKEKHLFKMEECEYQRESDKIHHENEMARQRIKSAEIKKMQERKEYLQLSKDQGYNRY